MKHLFIVNPTAGGSDKTELVRSQVVEHFKNRADEYEIYITQKPQDAPAKIKQAASENEHLRVYACGGDGTFNECVNGAAGLANTAVCPFPTGTGNDFCRMFGEEKDLYKDLSALLDGYEKPIDLISCNGRYSANICSVGIDARIGMDVHKYSKLPIIGGAAAYVVSTVINVFKGISQPMTVDAENFHVEGDSTLLCACNGRFYGGGFNPSLIAKPDDGMMDIYLVKKVNLFTLALCIGKYSSGRSDELPKYISHIRTDNIRIRFKGENLVNLDGEAMYASQVEMRIVPEAVKLIIPKGLHFFD